MVENARRLALGERDVASLLPAIKEQAQPQQIPMKILPLRVVLCVVAHTVFPRPGRIELQQSGDNPGKPAVEDAEKAALIRVDPNPHVAGIFQRGGFQGVTRDQWSRVRHARTLAIGRRIGRTRSVSSGGAWRPREDGKGLRSCRAGRSRCCD